MARILDRSKQIKFRKYRRADRYFKSPHTVVLHHTVSGGVLGTEEYLAKSTPYGYHYIIGRKGNIFSYADPGIYGVNHAKGANAYSIGISFIGGGTFGAATDEQLKSCIALIKELSKKYVSIKYVTGHKDVSPGRKIDPRFPGEPANGINEAIHVRYMTDIANKTNLKYKKGI